MESKPAKVEPLLDYLKPKKEKGIEFEKPGSARTILTLILMVCVLAGGALVTSWLVFRQSSRRRQQRKLHQLLASTAKDTPEAYHRAISALMKSPKAFGKNRSALLMARYGLMLSLSHGEHDFATTEKAISMLSGARNLKKGQELKATLRIAKALATKQNTKALLYTEKALVKYPRSHLLLFELALARLESGNWEAALASINMAIEIARSSKLEVLPYELLRASLLRKKGQLKRAERLLERLAAKAPDHGEIRLERAMLDPQKLPTKLPIKLHPRARAKGLYLKAQGLPAKKRRALCEKAYLTWPIPEATLCVMETILAGQGKITEIRTLLRRLRHFKLPSKAFFRAAMYVRLKDRARASRALTNLGPCVKCGKERVALLHIEYATFMEEKDALASRCTKPASRALYHACMGGAIALSHWSLVKKLLAHHPLKPQREQLEGLLFHFSSKICAAPLPPLSHPYLKRLYARALMGCARWGQALKLLSTIKPRGGADTLTPLLKTRVYMAMGRKSKAKRLLDSILPLLEHHPLSLYRAGRYYARMGKIDAAEIVVKKLTRVAPEAFYGPALQAALFVKLKQYRKAQRELDTAMRIARKRPELHNIKARILFHEGRYPQAAAAINRARALDRMNPRWLLSLASWSKYYKQDLFGQYYWRAFDAYMKFDAQVHASKILARYGAPMNISRDRNEKTKIFQKLLELKRLHPLATAFLAQFYHDQNTSDPKAVTLMRQAISQAPGLMELKVRLASWLIHTKKEEARKLLTSVLSDAPYHPVTQKARTLLNTLTPKGTP